MDTVDQLQLEWQIEHQEISFGESRFVNNGRTATEPSHDLAHLLIAANGNLPWCPTGTDRDGRLCEYNAVLIENLLGKFYYYNDKIAASRERILSETLTHMRWFVEEHYRPFPVPAEEAYRIFCFGLRPHRVAALSHIFFDLREAELSNSGVLEHGIKMLFYASDEVTGYGKWRKLSLEVLYFLTCLSSIKAFSDPVER